MATRRGLSIPTTARIPSSLRLPSSSQLVQKTFNRLSRASLVQLALDWLDESSDGLSFPVLSTGYDDESDFYPPMESMDELVDLYEAIQERKGPKREVLDRMLEGDWRAGISMYQLAMADFQYLYDHPTSQKWTTYRILPLQSQPSSNNDGVDVYSIDKKSLEIPRFHPSSFLEKLYSEVLPDVKTHCLFDRHKTLPLLILRLFIFDSPYSYDEKGSITPDDLSIETARTMYIAFPDAAPYLYITKPQSNGLASTTDNKSIRSLIVDGIPKALSKPRHRYALKATDFSSNNLLAILQSHSSARSSSAGGGWSIYADAKKKDTPLNRVLPIPPADDSDESGSKRKSQDTLETCAVKRRQRIAEGRFGTSGVMGDGKGIERLDVMLKSAVCGEDEDDETPQTIVRLCFSGSHVFAGIKQLIEAGAIDGEKMPGWMTGEEGVTVGTVEDGRIRGHKGSGL